MYVIVWNLRGQRIVRSTTPIDAVLRACFFRDHTSGKVLERPWSNRSTRIPITFFRLNLNKLITVIRFERSCKDWLHTKKVETYTGWPAVRSTSSLPPAANKLKLPAATHPHQRKLGYKYVRTGAPPQRTSESSGCFATITGCLLAKCSL